MKFELNLNRVFTLFLLCNLVFVFSCKKDESTNDNVRDNYLGTYAGAETCPGATASYGVVITAGVEDNELLIANIHNAGQNVITKATLDGTSLFIPSQLFSESGGYTTLIEGDGSVFETSVNVNFSLSIDGITEFCSVVCTK